MIKKLFKNRKAVTTIGVIGAAVPVACMMAFGDVKIDVDVFDGALIWKYNRSLGDDKFVIYRDGEKISTSTQNKYKDETFMDAAAPNIVEHVNAKHNPDSLDFSWADVSDLGTVSEYGVGVESADGSNIVMSSAVSLESLSGLSHYVVEFNGVSTEVYGCSYSVDMSKVKDGEYTFKIYSVDKAGNKSASTSLKVAVYKPYIDNKGIVRSNSREKHRFSAYLNDEDIAGEDGKIDFDKLKDLNGPNKINNVVTWDRGSSFSVTWKPSVDIGSKYELNLTGENGNGDMIASKGVGIGNPSGVKGYLYKINSSKVDVVTSEDSFTKNSFLMSVPVAEDKELYMHIAAVDENSNIGEVYSEKIR